MSKERKDVRVDAREREDGRERGVGCQSDATSKDEKVNYDWLKLVCGYFCCFAG